MANETGETWSKSWVPWLWKAWLAVVVFVIPLTLALFGVFEQTTLSKNAWQWLSEEHNWPLGWFILAVLLPTLGVSALFILLMQLLDKRRISEIQLLAKENGTKTTELENLKAVFHDRERMRLIDHITGIPNYQSWEEDLEQWASQGRNENEFSFILIDLDNLK
jgi:hypothetical protein